MNAFRTHAVVQEDGRIVVDKLPLRSGQTVEVLVLSPDLEQLPSAGASLSQKLLSAPCLSDEELKGVEEVGQWLASWPTQS